MDWTPEQLVAAAVLALLAYATVTCTCATLAARLKGQKTRHMLVVRSRRRRMEYVAAVVGHRSVNVDVVDPDEADDVAEAVGIVESEPPAMAA